MHVVADSLTSVERPGQSLLEGKPSAFVTSDRDTCAHSVTNASYSDSRKPGPHPLADSSMG